MKTLKKSGNLQNIGREKALDVWFISVQSMVKYFFFQILVSKRAALLLDQLMVALQDALRSQPRRELQKGNRMSMRSSTLYLPAENLSVLPLAQVQTVRVLQIYHSTLRVHSGYPYI